MLAEQFGVPVYINNDGNLFTLGEAMAGFFPEVNGLLERHGAAKRFRNLFGVTLGTGFGGGVVIDGELLIGDNSAAGEIWLMRHKHLEDATVEEGASIRAVRRAYAERAGIDAAAAPDPKSIFQIAKGERTGNVDAANKAFELLGESLGDALANAITLIDGLIVIGGGLSGAHELFLPRAIEEMNGTIGRSYRLEVKAFNLEDPGALNEFITGHKKTIAIPRSKKEVAFDSLQRVGIGVSRLGTARAVAIGAYAFALRQLDQ